MSLQITLDFLRGLRDNNNKEWFQANRDAYEAARSAFEDVLMEVVQRFNDVDENIPILEPKELMFRINRDVRFSKDKSPYKAGMSALIGPDGRKSASRYYYISVEPDDMTVVASGAKSPSSAMLKRVRTAIAADAEPLRSILEDETFKATFGELQGEQLKTAPKGFSKDHPDVDLLRYKEFMAQRYFSDEVVARDDFADAILETCRVVKPLVYYFHETMSNTVLEPR